jgi:zona occludens toxin
MIFGVSGRPGGGKSYELVKNHVIPALKDGRKIITNLPLQVDHFVVSLGHQVRDLIEIVDGEFHNFGDGNRPFSKAEHFLRYNTWRNDKNQGPVFFIDEAHLAMPAGSTQKELLEFLSLHRHYGFDIYLATQDFRKVHRDIRAMVEINYRCIKKSALGRTDQYIVKICQGCEAGAEVTNTYEREYESWVFSFYQSHTKANGKQVEEAYVKDIPIWWKKKRYILALLGIILGLFYGVGGFYSLFKPDTSKNTAANPSKNKPELPQHQNAALPTQPQPQPPKEPVKPPEVRFKYSPDAFHPFNKLQIHVTGVYQDVKEKVVYFALSFNGQKINEISSVDLMMSGYTVKVLSDCVVRLEYESWASFAICDHATNQMSVGTLSDAQTVAATN